MTTLRGRGDRTTQIVGWCHVLVPGGGSIKSPLLGTWSVRDDLAGAMRRA